MFRILLLIVLLCLVFSSPSFTLAAKPTPPKPPEAPTAPKRPEPPSLPEFPERSGVYKDQENLSLLVQVFVHKNPVAAGVNTSCLDPDASNLVGETGVRLPAGNWTYQLNTSSVPRSVGGTNLPTITKNAFAKFQENQSTVTFNRGPNTTVSRARSDRRNIIAWGRTSASALGVTYYWYYPSTGLIAETDTIMNTRFAWSWTDPSQAACAQNANTYDAQNILTHEIGHWLGLDDEYENEFADHTMFGYGSTGETKKNTLTTGDKAGITAIYP